MKLAGQRETEKQRNRGSKLFEVTSSRICFGLQTLESSDSLYECGQFLGKIDSNGDF